MNVTCSGYFKTSSQCLTCKENFGFTQHFTGDLFIKRTKRTTVDKCGCEKVNLFICFSWETYSLIRHLFFILFF